MQLADLDGTTKEELAYKVAQLVLRDGKSIADTAAELNKGQGEMLSRQNIYKLLQHAVAANHVRFVPLAKDGLKKKLLDRFRLDEEELHVIYDSDDVPRKAAELVHKHMQEIKYLPRYFKEHPIGIGLGPGGATADVALHLSAHLERDAYPGRIHLFALTGGGPANRPSSSPISFFNMFSDDCAKTALFAPSLVTQGQFDEMKDHPGVKEVFDAKNEDRITIVVTAMGDAPTRKDIKNNKIDDLLSQALHDRDPDELDKLINRGYVANVQYRPFDGDGNPIMEESPDDYRAATVLELEDLVEMVDRKHKLIVLMARNKKPESMIPILNASREKRLFSTVVLDMQTAQGVENYYKIMEKSPDA